ncbi:unnamed protein product [Blepharisma stoltei]|uniref:Uncharacterized protein n=1 Tax=Blepharisma stoltei TaxID=1481888 RepID=A0AAU9J0P9_9CILI|nr:unnamed protein product [Blepharisma stoltei]
MGTVCTRRETCGSKISQNFPIDSSPTKIGNLIFIDYLRYTDNCCSLDDLIEIIPDCIPTEILCYSLTKDSDSKNRSCVAVIGLHPDTSFCYSMLIEIHENWAFIQFGTKEMIEKIRQKDNNNIEFLHNPLPKFSKIGFHKIIGHVNAMIDLEINFSQDNYGKYLYRKLKNLMG